MTVIGMDRKQNQAKVELFVGSKLEVECETEGSELRSLFWETACEEIDVRPGKSALCPEPFILKGSFFLLHLFIFRLSETIQ